MENSEHVLQIIEKAKENKSTKLDLSNQRLTEIPIQVFEIEHLEWLNLNNNNLNNLPESISHLSNLNWLDLRNNHLKTIPKSISCLSNLVGLYLSNNELIILPESISDLYNLKGLDLGNNQLQTLPKSISNLTKLNNLDLRSNQFRNLPKYIIEIPNLAYIDLRNNPIEKVPLEVIYKGIEGIREYFRQLEQEGKDYIYEAKLIILGEAGAGKTTLVKKILNHNYQLQQEEQSTQGIDVIKWNFLLNSGQEFKVNIWDFGGQEIYHATHQFFLTRRSLYALVVDNRKEDTDFYYWLNLVELLSDNSPLLIVNNEKQDRIKEVPEKTLRGQFNNIQATLRSNLATNRGLDNIIKNIKFFIQELPHIGQTLPKTWVKVRQSLESDPRNYISLQEYFDLCQDNGFTLQKDKLQLSEYLHDLGVCLHFQDEKDSLLYKTVILKPEWGTDAAYKVLDNQQIKKNQGCFCYSDLENIWQDEKYAQMQGELLQLMMKFQLCYKIPQSKDKFIAPQLLTLEQVTYQWDDKKNLILRYKYPDFMPKGIITRFIVEMHKLIDGECINTENKQYVWRNGVVLKQKHETEDNKEYYSRAEIIEYYGRREIAIRVSGQFQRDLMTQIVYELDKISDSFNRLNYQKLIPCNCHWCKSITQPHYYPVKTLQNFIVHNQAKIQCQKHFEMVTVIDLIDETINSQELANFQNINHFRIVNIQGDYNDRSRNQKIDANELNSTGAASLNTGDIKGVVSNENISLLSLNYIESDKNVLRDLLQKLKQELSKIDFNLEEKEEALEQIQSITEALNESENRIMKKLAKTSTKLLQSILTKLPSNSLAAHTCDKLPELVNKIF